MTTIAYRDGVIAADSYASTKDFLWYRMHKIARHECGALIGGTGTVVWIDRLLRAFQAAESKDLTRLLDVGRVRGGGGGLLVTRHGDIYVIESTVQFPIKDSYYAIGSGGAFALSAMDAGASAVQAVRIAIKRDPYSAGAVQQLSRGG